MGKLVRDRIPEMIEADGRHPVTRVLAAHEYGEQLHAKLAEEADELREAPENQRLEEMADVYEVLSALAAHHGHTIDDVAKAAEAKRMTRGGFEMRIWLESW